MIVQNPEEFKVGGWLPEEWTASTSGRVGTALCSGILGGSWVDLISHYADLGIRSMERPAHRTASSDEEEVEHSVLLQQYLLAACTEFHAARPGSPFHGIEPRCLFPTAGASRDPEAARYTHLIGTAKAKPALARRLEARVERDYPQHYERLLRLTPRLAAEEDARCA